MIDFRPRTPEDAEVIVEADIKIKKGHASVKAIDVNSIDAHPMLLSFSANRESVWVPVTTKAQQNADNADSAENAKMKSAILLGFLRKQ